MLAVIGYCVPGYIGTFGDTYLSFSEKVKFSDIPNGLQAIFKIPTLGVFQVCPFFLPSFLPSRSVGHSAYAQILLFIGILETQFPNVNGDYGTGYFGQFLDEPIKSKKLAIEISNGRLAMLAILGLMAQDVVTGGNPFEIQSTITSYTAL